MSSKLKVDGLRAQLSTRGLDTAGTKSALVRRLDAALRKERKEEEASRDARENGASNAGKKRPRDEPEVSDGIERLREMSVRELRELASLRGLPAHGSKRELVERFSVDAEKGSEEVLEGKEIEGSKKEKLITATKKGRTVLDQYLPDHIKSNYHVLQQGGEVYDAILNQTNVGENNNKFYVIQALGPSFQSLVMWTFEAAFATFCNITLVHNLFSKHVFGCLKPNTRLVAESDAGRTFMVYNRWGRVGVRGQDKLHGPYTSRERAINEFQMKFFDKTKNQWSHRQNFTCYPKCYTWLEMDYSETEKETVMQRTSTFLSLSFN